MNEPIPSIGSIVPYRLLISSVVFIGVGLFLATKFANNKRIGVGAALILIWLGLLRLWLTFFVPLTWEWWL